MGKKPAARQPSPMWVTTADLPTSAGHPFFERLNRVLEEAGFDAFVEGLCAVFYASRLGRPTQQVLSSVVRTASGATATSATAVSSSRKSS